MSFNPDFLKILLVTLMLWIFFQDYKSRTLNLYVSIFIFIISLVIVIYSYSIFWILEVILYNLLLLSFFYGMLLLYYSLRKISVKQVFKNKLGLGDIIFTIVITPCFTVKNLLAFLLFSFLFSILIHQCLRFISANKPRTIPLAGNMAIFFILVEALSLTGINEPINSLI